MTNTFKINDEVIIIDESGSTEAEGRKGQRGTVFNFFMDDLPMVRMADGAVVTMYPHRFAAAPAEPVLTAPANPVTKIDKLKAHFLSGRSLTQLEAIGLYGAFRLAARVHDLKGQGWKIATKMKEDPNGNPYAEYALSTAKRA